MTREEIDQAKADIETILEIRKRLRARPNPMTGEIMAAAQLKDCAGHLIMALAQRAEEGKTVTFAAPAELTGGQS